LAEKNYHEYVHKPFPCRTSDGMMLDFYCGDAGSVPADII